MVWPLSLSLATTQEISVDFSSSPYLDVSVQAVSPVHLWIQCTVRKICLRGLLHSDISGSMRTYRSPKRPSSAPNAKAFALRSLLLYHLLHVSEFSLNC